MIGITYQQNQMFAIMTATVMVISQVNKCSTSTNPLPVAYQRVRSLDVEVLDNIIALTYTV